MTSAAIDELIERAGDTLLAAASAPAKVIGANAVGLELGQMLGNFGSQVTFISRRALTPR